MFSSSARLVKSQIVLTDPSSGKVKQVIPLQYNPESFNRNLQVQSIEDSGDRSQALRLTSPPIETFKIDAEIDAMDRIGGGRGSKQQDELSIHPHLAALEMLVYPSTEHLQSNHQLARRGVLEIVPMESPLTLFVWSKKRVIPVRVTDFSVEESEFDSELNPIRAKITLGMRVLSVDDLGFNHKGGSLYMVYQQQKEKLSKEFFRNGR